MSQQKKANIIFAVIIVLFVIICVGLTCYFIIRHNKSVDKLPVINTDEEGQYQPYIHFSQVSDKDTIDIYKEYPVNPIDINLVGKVSIDGLKNLEVEDRVNKILSELNALEDEEDYGCYVNFNVSNVLSITCDEEARNIDLTTGKEIKFEELFNQNTNMDALIRAEAYQYACSVGTCLSDNYYEDDYENTVEQDMISFLQDYKEGKSTFGINYTSFSFYTLRDDYGWYYHSSYAPYYDELTIYNRFLTDEDIYQEEITNYCLPQACGFIDSSSNSNLYYQTGEFLNDTNYLEFYVYNSSGSNLVYDDFSEYPFNMKEIGEKIKEQLVEALDLEQINHFKNISVNASIYNNELNGYQIEYGITIQTLDEQNFYKSVLSYELETEIEREEIYKADIIMDTSGNISFLEDNPCKLFPNFEEVLYQYIMDDLAKAELDDSYYSEFNNYYVGLCEFSEDLEECYRNRDFHELIKDANYALDSVNQRIHMYHMIPGIGMATSYVSVFLPFSLFNVQSEDLSY